MDLSEEERLKRVMDAYLKMQPKSRSDVFMEQTDMSSYSESTRMLFNLIKAKEEKLERDNIEKIKKAVSEFTKQLAEEKLKAEEKRIAKEQRQSEKKRIAEEKRVSEILLPDLEDLDKSSKSKTRSSGGRKKNNKTKKHKK
jgi:hypothetical protein